MSLLRMPVRVLNCPRQPRPERYPRRVRAHRIVIEVQNGQLLCFTHRLRVDILIYIFKLLHSIYNSSILPCTSWSIRPPLNRTAERRASCSWRACSPDIHHLTYDLIWPEPRVFPESTTPPHEQLPVVFESTDDPSLNLTRTDLNCDKTGTCYDGQYTYQYIEIQ